MHARPSARSPLSPPRGGSTRGARASGSGMALRSAWPRVRARADRRPVNGGYGTTEIHDCVSSSERSVSREARAGAEVFEKPSGDEDTLRGPPARTANPGNGVGPRGAQVTTGSRRLARR